jgi:3-oxoacyl-[acyl-carrier protein] reductase
MELGLAGRRALVAGSSSGIGAAIARALAGEGVEVMVHGRSERNAREVVADISERGGTAFALTARLDDPVDVDRLAADALATGPIDILINSAGAATAVHGWFESGIGDWQRQYQFSTLYAVQLIRALIAPMRERGWGRILNLSSAAAFKPMALHPEYSAAKLALHAVASSLASELGSCGVTVNTLVSGLVLTGNTQSAIQQAARQRGFTETGAALEHRVITEVWKAHLPLSRAGKVEELAAAACFLVSERAGYITGASLRVDGGASGFVQ